MILYADADDLITWVGNEDTENPAPLLRKASILVGRACRNDLYYTQPNGLPVDDDLSEAMRDATCAQVEAWVAAGIDPVAGMAGQTPAVSSTSMDGASITFDATALTAAATARADAATGLCADAYDILRAAGLASANV